MQTLRESSLQRLDGFEENGKFYLARGKSAFGRLRLCGDQSSLKLQSDSVLSLSSLNKRHINGTLNDRNRVSLIDCVPTTGLGAHTKDGKSTYFAELFPHYVTVGDRYLPEGKSIVSSVHVYLDDAITLFYDFHAFGSVLEPNAFIKDILKAQFPDKRIPVGPHPEILYYTGKAEIFKAHTLFGEISASHNPNFSLPTPAGLNLKNAISINLKFEPNVQFSEAISWFLKCLIFFEIIVGRPQNLLDMFVRLRSPGNTDSRLRVYWSLPPIREMDVDSRKPHPGDNLADAANKPEHFAAMLESWVEQHAPKHDSRFRFTQCFRQQQTYSIDRLVGAANMFDILPKSAIGARNSIPEDLSEAIAECRRILLGTRRSAERDSILSHFGRIDEHSLKTKVKNRANIILTPTKKIFPDLYFVIDEAINCRNYFVHGSTPHGIEYNSSKLLSFFTDSLEFIFAASDLMDAGWNIEDWIAQGSTLSHPFARYRHSYSQALQELRQTVSRQISDYDGNL